VTEYNQINFVKLLAISEVFFHLQNIYDFVKQTGKPFEK